MKTLAASQTDRRSRKRADWQAAIILSIEPQTPRISSIFLAPERPFSFVPGQHVSLRVVVGGGAAERKYSIASAPESGAVLELAVERLPGGEVSSHLHGSAAPGDAVQIRGPRGAFTWSEADGGPILLIAGGSGLAPLMSMIRHRALRKSSVPVGLLYSAATWEDVLFREELCALADARDGFELMLTLTRDVQQRTGVASRRVDRALIGELLARLPGAVRNVFICGSDPFVDNARSLVANLGIGDNQVRTESYNP